MGHIGDNIVSFFKNATTKLEELQVQTALGKAELSDRLEEIKKEARKKVQDFKAEMNSEFIEDKEIYTHLKTKLEHLDLQLALGKAEAKEELHEQKQKIKEAIREVKELLKKD